MGRNAAWNPRGQERATEVLVQKRGPAAPMVEGWLVFDSPTAVVRRGAAWRWEATHPHVRAAAVGSGGQAGVSHMQPLPPSQ